MIINERKCHKCERPSSQLWGWQRLCRACYLDMIGDGYKQDAAAIRGDWGEVGQDIADSIEKYGELVQKVVIETFGDDNESSV